MNSKPYSAGAWRAAAAAAPPGGEEPAEELPLPSGMVVKARRPDLQQWILQGRLPAAFSALLVAGQGEASAAPPSAEDVLELGRFTFALVSATVLEPRIVRGSPASAAEINYADVPPADVDAIMAYAQRSPEAAALGSFRGGREPAATGVDGATVRRAPKRAGGHRRPRAGA